MSIHSEIIHEKHNKELEALKKEIKELRKQNEELKLKAESDRVQFEYEKSLLTENMKLQAQADGAFEEYLEDQRNTEEN